MNVQNKFQIEFLSISFFILLFTLSNLILGQSWSPAGPPIIGKDNSNIGYYIAMPNQKTLAISSAGYNSPDSKGFVEVYSWNGYNWIKKGNTVVEPGEFASFGVLDMPDANTFAVSAPYNDLYLNSSNLEWSGYVQVFQWKGGVWTQKGADIFGTQVDEVSGNSISMPDSNTLAIGAYGGSNSFGHVKVYHWISNSWVQKGQTLVGEKQYEDFGYQVDMPDSNTLTISAPDYNGSSNRLGQVKVYKYNGNSWVQKGASIDGNQFNESLGRQLSMPDSNTLAVGSPYFNNQSPYRAQIGRVQIFRWTGNSWVLKGTSMIGSGIGEHVGNKISMPDSNTIAISNRDVGGNPAIVKIYKWKNNNWLEMNAINTSYLGGFAAGLGKQIMMPDSNTLAIGSTNYLKDSTKNGRVDIYQNYDLLLPIELNHFTATLKSDYVLLEWETIAEINNDYYTIEKTKDGVNYVEVGNVKGAGNSLKNLSYKLLDLAPYSGTSYYRLKQTDYNGAYTYSELEAVEFGRSSILRRYNLYPNPTSGKQLFFNLISVESGRLELQIRTMNGELLKTRLIILDRMDTNYEFELLKGTKLAVGTYMVTFLMNDKIIGTKRFVVK